MERAGVEGLDDVGSISEEIANGHAYDKHVVENGEYPEISSQGNFKSWFRTLWITQPSRSHLGAGGMSIGIKALIPLLLLTRVIPMEERRLSQRMGTPTTKDCNEHRK